MSVSVFVVCICACLYVYVHSILKTEQCRNTEPTLQDFHTWISGYRRTCRVFYMRLHNFTHAGGVTWTRELWAPNISCWLFSPDPEREPKGWARDRALWTSPLTGNGQKKKSPFSEEWLALLSAEAELRSLDDKDATDRLKADDHFKRTPASQWRRALSTLTKPNWIPMIISEWFPRGEAVSVVVLSRQRKGIKALCLNRPRRSISKYSKLKYECMCEEREAN